MKGKHADSKIIVPKGFLFSAVEAAIKKEGRKDLALIYSETEAVVSGMFTANRIKAAPVKLDMQRIRSGRGRAIIANSGNANACFGKQGMKHASEMAALVADGLGLAESSVYVCSTGVIGTPMPMEKIAAAIPRLLAGLRKGTILDAASAIMTTDTFPKVLSRRVKVRNGAGTIAGICKGAGMICPQMATMLCFIVTDLAIGKRALDKALRGAVEKSFNKLTIDGDMSTNDTVIAMANGKAGNVQIGEGSAEFAAFGDAISGLTFDLARLVARDGEGATKLVEVEVKNARNRREADKAAFAVANSLLVKTAIYGNDANWGRIMAALGYANIRLEEEKIDIWFGRVKVARKGIATGKDREAAEVLRGREIRITADLHMGGSSSRVLTCDLTEAYVKINAEYRT